jgi:tetratricopeptide (TPR) repeat protein
VCPGPTDVSVRAQILYNLAKITFHSQRISRHLFTLLVAAEAYDEARMALELYAQIFEKAKEGDAADSAALVEEGRRRKEADAAAEANDAEAPEHEGISDEAKRVSQEATTDQDSDAVYVSTLLHGAHVYGRFLHDIKGADALARKAYDAHTANPKLSTDRSLSARAKRIAGSARAALAARESDATKRAALQDEALSLLKQSATLDDQSSETFYQLAYLQAEMRDSTTAVRSARLALELEPADVQCWHLLALLRSAQKDFKGALRIAEEGLAEAEEDDEADLKAVQRASSANGVNGTSKTSVARTVLLSVDYPPTYGERAEALLRLHMTHSALEEVVSGTEAAIASQRDVFSFFHKRVATTAVLPLGAGGAAGSAAPPTKHGKHSTLLGGSAAVPTRFGSLSGMGLSGATHHHSEEAHRGASLLPHLHRRRASQKVEEAPMPAGAAGATSNDSAQDAQDDGEASTAMVQREARRAKHEAHLLASLWLQSAASFRRAHQLSQARAAVQEAERLDSARAEVWVQLALYFEAQQQWELAVQSLYKALACESECVPAVVNLARIFLQHPDLSPAASALPTSETIKDRKLPAAVTDALAVPSPFGNDGAAASTTLAKPTELGAIALAEGLLRASTASAAWDCAAAWLFLAQTARRTGRLAQSRTFLEYALELEKTETVRPLGAALFRS